MNPSKKFRPAYMLRAILFIILLLITAAPGVIRAVDGVCPDPLPSFTIDDGDVAGLIAALEAADDETCTPGPDTIMLAQGGSYSLRTTSSELQGGIGLPTINSEIIITGNGARITRAGGTDIPEFRFFLINATGNLSLQGLTLASGRVSELPGGAIYNLGTLALDAVTLHGNQALSGGALFSTGTDAHLTVQSSSFLDNTASLGGAILQAEGSSTRISDSNFIENRAVAPSDLIFVQGGALYNSNAQLSVNGSTFTSNAVVGQFGSGGAIFNEMFTQDDSSVLIVSDSRFESNAAHSGGGIASKHGEIDLTRSLMLNNSASGDGGAIFAAGAVTITNSTLTGNSAVNGGGIHIDNSAALIQYSTIRANQAQHGGGISGNEAVSVFATILSNNSGGNCTGALVSSGYNIADDVSCVLTGPKDANAIDPLLGELADNGGPTASFDLQPDSPAVDRLPKKICRQNSDQRLAERPVDGNADGIADCDSGAVEILSDAGRITPTPTPEPGGNLVDNGSIETFDQRDKLPEGWRGKDLLQKDKVKTNKTDRPGKEDKIVAHEGDAAFQLKSSPGHRSRLIQILDPALMDTVPVGTELELKVYVRGKSMTRGGSIRLRIKYINPDVDKGKINLRVPEGTYDYVALADTITLAAPVRKVKVIAQFRKPASASGGKFFFDTVSLSEPEARNANTSGLLTLPTAIPTPNAPGLRGL